MTEVACGYGSDRDFVEGDDSRVLRLTIDVLLDPPVASRRTLR